MKTGSKNFNEEQTKFIYDHYKGIGNQELADLVNAKYGTSFTKAHMKSFKAYRKLDSGLTGYFPKGNIPFNKGKKMSKEQYEKCKGTMFKKGDIPGNTLPIGTEVKDKDGYIFVKIANTPKVNKYQNWKLKQRIIFENKYGPIPEGNVVIFKDGNNHNFDINNLACITREELLKLNHDGLIQDNPQLTEAGILVVKLNKLIKEKKKEGNKK